MAHVDASDAHAPARAALALVALLLLLAGGCRAAAPAGSSGGPPAARPSPTPAGRLLVGLVVEDAEGRRQTTFRQGTPVALVLVVQNRGRAPARLALPTAQLYDFWVERDGQPVWRWSADRSFASVVTEVDVPVGETRVFREVWPQTDAAGRQVPPGAYAARGALLTGREPLPTPPLPIAVSE